MTLAELVAVAPEPSRNSAGTRWQFGRRGIVAMAIAVVLAAAGCSGQRPALGTVGILQSVAALSARDAWAVGREGAEGCGCGKTLIVHWDGTAWSQVPSPTLPEPIASLSAVAFISASAGWAVGAAGGDKPLIERWSGRRWSRVPVPAPSGGASLNAVDAMSATTAWAVGSTGGLAKPRPLIERWNGKRWQPVPNPVPLGGGTLNGVTVASATSAWAVGSSLGGALIEHWNGRSWKLVRGPASSVLQGVAAISATSAWAVGYNNGHGNRSLILHLTGSNWTQVPSPTPSRRCIGAVLMSVATTPAGAWAVGGYACAPRTLALRWDGKIWKRVASPTPAGSNFLMAVATTPAGRALAVGSAHGGTGTILIEHWDGSAWTWARRR